MRFLLGIDGGGTRTTLALADPDGREIARRTGPAGIVDPRHPEAAAEMLSRLSREAIADAGLSGQAAVLCAMFYFEYVCRSGPLLHILLSDRYMAGHCAPRAIQLRNALRTDLQVDVPVGQLFESASLVDLANDVLTRLAAAAVQTRTEHAAQAGAREEGVI